MHVTSPRFFPAVVVVFAALFWLNPTRAAELIESFDSVLTVNADGTLTVEETIQVNVEQRAIRHGIFRDLPIRAVDDRGQTIEFDYKILNVQRGDRNEPYQELRVEGHKRIRIGKASVLLDRTQHTYKIVYQTDRQVRFFEGYDEVYWNVTGQNWELPIERASVKLLPPPGTGFDRVRSYTGQAGSTQSATRRRDNLDGSVFIETTSPIRPGEGFTVAGIWPKGAVTPPPRIERFLKKVGGIGLLPIFGGYGFLLVYFFIVWLKHGRDPKAGPLVPRYYPPSGLGPAALRYVENMGVDDKTLTAAILSMAVKRYLVISEQGPNEYFLERTFRKNVKLTKAEKKVADALYLDGPARFDVSRFNGARLVKAKRDLEQALKSEYEKAYFQLNTGYVLIGAAIGLALLAWLALTSEQAIPGLFMCLWLGFWGAGTYEAVARLRTKWLMAARRASLGEILSALASSAPALIMFIGLIAGFAGLMTIASPAVGGIAMLIVTTCVLFHHWMKAPTRLGRRLLDEIAGFRQYLKLAEQERMDFFNPLEMTPDVYEAYLPHAMALDVEHSWSELFEDELAEATNVESGGSARYRPSWYYAGGTRPFAAKRFSHVLATQFAGSLTRASSPPNRSSGSAFGGSGGFSGGGSGGGGGGGW